MGHLTTFLSSTKLLDAILIPSHGQDGSLCGSATGQAAETRNDQKDYSKGVAKNPGVPWLKWKVAPLYTNIIYIYI